VPVGYRYFDLEQTFPRRDRPFATAAQAALGNEDHEPATLVQPDGTVEGSEFDRYQVEHQFRRDIDAIYRQQHISQLIEIVHFKMYVDQGNQYLLTSGAKGKIAKAALNRLRKADPPIRSSVPEIPLGDLLLMGDVTGGWFGDLAITDVDSAALFGSNRVVSSSEWQRYARVGDLRSIVLRAIDPDGNEQALQLTHQRLILLYKEQPEGSALRFVRTMQETIDGVLEDA
jgi:hypothetical protein